MDIIFPVLAVLIYWLTPKGCDKTISWILAGLFVLIWSFEEAIVRVNIPVATIFDGAWYDASIMSIFLAASYLLYKAGGKIQYKLSLFGAFICVFYASVGATGLYYGQSFRADYLYAEVMYSLYFLQLFYSGGGMLIARINSATSGANNERRAVSGYRRHNSRAGDAGNGSP